jgi:predicted transcriptional regulator
MGVSHSKRRQGRGKPTLAVQLSRLKASIRSLEGTLVPEILKRALSIRQPLSELILRGEKTLEFRSRLTRIRERVYLYAGKKLALVHDFPDEEAQRLPRGVIVGSVEIIDCHEDAEGFAWELAGPVRYFRPLVPHGVPQPGFWYPTF